MNGDGLKALSAQAAHFFSTQVGTPTPAQAQAWPLIARGQDVLVSAPTGTGKTLAAFLVFIDRLTAQSRAGTLKEGVQVVYISPLKSLAADIRENLRRPLAGVEGAQAIRVGVRTGDTTQTERARMAKHPPHILITTPESLFLMLTSRAGQGILCTAQALIIDELHALIDTKRGAHLMLSVARLERLCGRKIQRVGLSATIRPLSRAGEYLSPAGAELIAPEMEKRVCIKVCGAHPSMGQEKSPVWEDIAAQVYARCREGRSVIAFTEARRFAEKLSYYVNLLGGEGFSRVHHGSLSKEQRAEAEEALRAGTLRLLCATSSMELGIDVGDIDEVLQVGCPRTVSGTLQRLGRAGHNPGRTSVMRMYPRTPLEGIYCGMTAQIAREGGVEEAAPPRCCLDVLSQHLVSMAVGTEYSVDDVMDVLARTYTFRDVTREQVKECLRMLAGAYEHGREIPVRARVLYDPVHERVSGDAYSRMLAVSAGGTIPDKGMYAARTQEGVRIGELDEEFVYETRLGDTFLLGAFGWRVVRLEKDSVVVAPSKAAGGRVPFWKGETKGRAVRTSMAFGRMLRHLSEEREAGRLDEALEQLGLDEIAIKSAADLISRQIAVTGALPNEKTIIIEHFTDASGSRQMMVHSFFGRRINAPLSLLLQQAARERGLNVGSVDEEDGFLLYAYGDHALPDGLFSTVHAHDARERLEAMLMATPLFGMTFRYNAARALMMGVRGGGRQPLWRQRLRSAELLDQFKNCPEHPLVVETRRECLEDQWDIAGVEALLRDVHAGRIAVREIHVDAPSPLSLPLQWQVEAAEMYAYFPVTEGVKAAALEQLTHMTQVKPAREELERTRRQGKAPEDARALYALLQREGDCTARELEDAGAPLEWIDALRADGLAAYVEPGLWIAAEQVETYGRALAQMDVQSAQEIVRRLLYYKGAHTLEEVAARYALPVAFAQEVICALCEDGEAILDGGAYYHARLYERARKATLRARRLETPACPVARYAALAASQVTYSAPAEEQLTHVLDLLDARAYPAALWENVIFPRRVRAYRETLLDRVLSQGEYVWHLRADGQLGFAREETIDWEAQPMAYEGADKTQALLYDALCTRGAAFFRPLTRVLEEGGAQAADAHGALLSLTREGLVRADSFVPVRQLLCWDKLEKAPARQRVNTRIQAMNAGRWDVTRPVKQQTLESFLEALLAREVIVCSQTYRQAVSERLLAGAPDWGEALRVLGLWEYTGRVRRGYFVAGLSGAQFVRAAAYEGIAYALSQDSDEWVCISAADPAFCYGREVESARDAQGEPVRRLPGTVVALHGGRPVLSLERQGHILRVLDSALCAREEETVCALRCIAEAFLQKSVLVALPKLTVKEYPASLSGALEAAKFVREMRDFVLRRQ